MRILITKTFESDLNLITYYSQLRLLGLKYIFLVFIINFGYINLFRVRHNLFYSYLIANMY